MKQNRDLYELKLHELKFTLKKLQIHEKIHAEASSVFSESFKDYIYSINDKSTKHKLKQIAGLAGENERPMTKTAKKAKQAGQYRRGKTKVNARNEQRQDIPPPPPPPNKKVPPEYKSLYRKISRHLHPDKVGNDEAKASMLTELNSAISSGEFFKIIECALNIGVEISEEVPLKAGEVDTQIEINKKKIKDLTKSVAWEWYHLDKQSDKESMIEGYATYLLNNV